MGLRAGAHAWGPGVLLVSLAGDVDVNPAAELRKAFMDFSNQGFHTLVVDLNDVDFIHATGLGVLMGAHKRAQAHGGSVDLICRQESILMMLDQVGWLDKLRVYSSQADARTHLGSGLWPADRTYRVVPRFL